MTNDVGPTLFCSLVHLKCQWGFKSWSNIFSQTNHAYTNEMPPILYKQCFGSTLIQHDLGVIQIFIRFLAPSFVHRHSPCNLKINKVCPLYNILLKARNWTSSWISQNIPHPLTFRVSRMTFGIFTSIGCIHILKKNSCKYLSCTTSTNLFVLWHFSDIPSH